MTASTTSTSTTASTPSWLRLLPVFCLSYMIGYQVDDYLNLPLIKYYPNLGTFGWGWLSTPGGHNTIGYWGWMAWGLIAAIVVTALYALIPRRVTDKITWGWAWVVPVGMAIFAFYIVKTNWWSITK